MLTYTKIYKLLAIVFFTLICFSISAQIRHGLRDENGRHEIARGFVVVTNNTFFTPDDYSRMVRLGANYQVIRLELGKLSTFPGARLDDNYVEKLDSLVQLGKQVGIKSVFKMTTYGVRSFS